MGHILANAHHTVLYVGVTNNLIRRVSDHKCGKGSEFTRMSNVSKLVYFEMWSDINAAIAREKQIKGGSTRKKVDLIESINPEWQDLFEDLLR